MEEEQHTPIEETEVFRLFVEVSDRAWKFVKRWPPLAQNTIGTQLVRSLDRVGATLVEGDGRYGHADALHFFIMARASAREGRFWIQRATVRDLISAREGQDMIAPLANATRQLNGLIRYRRTFVGKSSVRERPGSYLTDGRDPFACD